MESLPSERGVKHKYCSKEDNISFSGSPSSKTFMALHSRVHIESDRSNYVRNKKKRELERAQVDVNVILSVLESYTNCWHWMWSFLIMFNNIKTLFMAISPLYYPLCYVKVTLLPTLALEPQWCSVQLSKWHLIPRDTGLRYAMI